MSIPASEVDAALWRALAGSSIKIPSANSIVYYFPQGHLEHSSNSTANAAENCKTNVRCLSILCRVLSVRFLCSHTSDQAFVKFLLLPIHASAAERRRYDDGDEEDEKDVVSFSKILTPSDANNGGGFSVPRFCADSIFPRLNFEADPPVQNLMMRDSHNTAWAFRHIYRGTPQRHLLTTGWSKFVNGKRLVSGDSVVFMQKKSTGELFIGVKRSEKSASVWDCNENRAEICQQAIESAARGMAFEVSYYPRAGMSDFVVSAEKVEDSMRTNWSMGMRVKMAVETEDSSRMTWFQGTIDAASWPEVGPWAGSPWRMLQVAWDEPEILNNPKRVSPWQVECIFPPELHSPFPPLPPPPTFKKLKVDPPMFPNREEEPNSSFPITELTRPITMHNSGMFHYSPNFSNTSIQGTRLDPIHLHNSQINNTYHPFTELLKNSTENEHGTRTGSVSTVLNIGSSLHSDNLSPPSRGSVDFSGNSLGRSCFQLFGKTIDMSKPGGSSDGSRDNGGESNGGIERR